MKEGMLTIKRNRWLWRVRYYWVIDFSSDSHPFGFTVCGGQFTSPLSARSSANVVAAELGITILEVDYGR